MRRSALLFDESNRPTPAFREFLKDVGIPGTNLAEIDDALQRRFFQKDPDGQPLERWELKEVEVGCSADRIKEHLTNNGFVNETYPSSETYDYAAWPGGLVTRVAVRLNDLVAAWQNGVRWKQTIVFGGKRPLQPDKENYETSLKAVPIDQVLGAEYPGNSWKGINPQTELDLMTWMWHVGEKPAILRMKGTTFVDAPMKPPLKEGGQPVRPTSEDTVQAWLDRYKPKPGSVLLSSGAPYGMAMHEAFRMLLEPHGFTVETFGHKAPDLPVENMMREVAGCVNRIRRTRVR